MTESHWDTALEALNGSSSGIYGPRSFRDYLQDAGADYRDFRTAAEISVDTKRDLATELRENDTMVLRLGSAPESLGTQFALVRVPDLAFRFRATSRRRPSVSTRLRPRVTLLRPRT
jgi:hypothetical protein